MLVLSKGKLVILVVIAVVNALVSVYYYLRPVVAMYMDDAAEDREEIADSTASFALLVAALAVVLMGLLPQPITDIASKAGKAVWYENATGIQDGPVGALAPFARTGSKEDSDRDASNPAGALPK
jgi:formate hydrogenlyase subunit 3/multisubunit Na+/H+ antiporter MnhD subunit